MKMEGIIQGKIVWVAEGNDIQLIVEKDISLTQKERYFFQSNGRIYVLDAEKSVCLLAERK